MEDSGWGSSKVYDRISSLEEKGYLYKNQDNYHPQTGAELIVAEDEKILQRVLASENLFENGEAQPEPETESTSQGSPLPPLPKEIARQFSTELLEWHRLPPPRKPVDFAFPPFRETNRSWGKMDKNWRIWVNHHPAEAFGVRYGGDRKRPSIWGNSISAMAETDLRYSGDRANSISAIAETHYRITKNKAEQLRRITKLKLLQSRRYSNVRRHSARTLAEVNSNSIASNRQTEPDLDRSHNRLWVKMFEKKDGHPYHGIRAYIEGSSSSYRATLKDNLSIYWFNPDAEWEDGVLPKKPEEIPNIEERPLDEDADPQKAHDVPERFTEVGLLAGKSDPHPHDQRFRSKVAIKALGAEIFGGIDISVKEEPCPWPEPNPEPDRELSFAGHRPEEQPAEIKKAGSYVTSTAFIRMAKEEIDKAIAEENSGHENIPEEPSPIDHERAEKYGKDPEGMMLLRQVAEVIMSPHVFEIENTYESPGRDPWPIRMYSKLAFPEVDLSSEAKKYIDENVTQARPTSPTEWANVLLMGIRQGWDPRWVKNFVKCYRHEMHIERDPNRDPTPGGPRTSKGEIRRGNGIDLSQGDPKEIIPPNY